MLCLPVGPKAWHLAAVLVDRQADLPGMGRRKIELSIHTRSVFSELSAERTKEMIVCIHSFLLTNFI